MSSVNLTLAPSYTASMTLTGPGGTLTLTTATDEMVLALGAILRGPPGPAGPAFANLDGGRANSIYGGTTPIDGGGA